MSQYRNETGRAVIRLPGADHYEIPVFLALYIEDGRPTLLGDVGSDVPRMVTRWHLFETLCRTRAPLTVRGELCVDGEVVRPERYLGLWRTAMAAPVTPSELALLYGVTIRATLTAKRQEATAALLSGAKATFINPGDSPDERPVASMEEFDSRWGRAACALPGVDGLFCATLDFRDTGAAADAYLFSELALSSPYRRIAHVSLDLTPSQQHAAAVRAGLQSPLPFAVEDVGHVA